MFAASKTKQVSSAAVFVEDVMSTYLYTGTGATQTITNNINLSTYGGLVWIKNRTLGTAAEGNRLTDTSYSGRGFGWTNVSNDTVGRFDGTVGGFSSTGFTLNASYGTDGYLTSGSNYASWTFRKQAKFFDVVTYTGTGANRTISHNLGSVPGCIIVKRTDTTGNWQVYHNGLTSAAYSIQLNLTNAQASAPTVWNSTAPTSTVFSVGTDATVNASGGTYVAYLFAHNAGGFGLTGTDNVISCGSFTTDASGNATVNLGYEPQWILYKDSQTVTGWRTFDVMRGWALTGGSAQLFPNTSSAENNAGGTNQGYPTATGFVVTGQSPSKTLIYIAIRRGPMKTPTSGTSVFTPVARAGTSAAASISSGFVTDLIFDANRTGGASGWWDRLRGPTLSLSSYGSAAEFTDSQTVTSFSSMTGVSVGSDTTNGFINLSPNTYVNYMLGRAPGFFDEVCYTGTGASPNTQKHNLGVAPELVIVKSRTTAYNWAVWHSFTGSDFKAQYLNTTGAAGTISYSSTYMPSAPTTSQIAFGTTTLANDSGGNYVAYLFASCPGVSKVGSYTGNGTTQTINCGFTGGARFVLIKRTDSTGDWYVYDTARGMTSLTDPYLLLNSTAAEAATLGSVTTVSGGFALNAAILAAINTNAASYIYLAIA